MTREVLPAFEMLLEELEAIIPILNEQASRLVKENKYDNVRKIMERAEFTNAFQQKVINLRDEWIERDFPSTRDQSGESNKDQSHLFTQEPLLPIPSTRVSGTRLRPGLRTSNEELRLPILQALVDLGGAADFGELLKRLEVTLKPILNKYDWSPLPTDADSVRWKNNVAWAKAPLRKAGLLRSDSQLGTWEITEKGRAVAKNERIDPLFHQTKPVLGNRNRRQDYDQDYHLSSKPKFIRDLYIQLRNEIYKLSPNIEEKHLKIYIRFLIFGKGFVDIHLQNYAIKLWVKPKIELLYDPHSLCRDVSKLGHYGNGDTEITLTNNKDIGKVINLIQQSFNYMVKKA